MVGADAGPRHVADHTGVAGPRIWHSAGAEIVAAAPYASGGELRSQVGVFGFYFGFGGHESLRLGVVDLVSRVLVAVDQNDV